MKIALFVKIILVLQLYMFCKILVKIIAILDAQLLFESFVSVDVSVSVKMEKNRIRWNIDHHNKNLQTAIRIN